jgi:hypothetical protein
MAITRMGVSAILTVLILLGVSVLSLTNMACNSGGDMEAMPPSNPVAENTANPVNSVAEGSTKPVEPAKKGNPKLDSQLRQLISAEARGEASLYAEQINLELVDNNVRVIIECEPGQLEVATQAAVEAGAKLETSYDNLLQVLMPITELDTLADAAGIRFIRLPQPSLPAVG